MGAGDAILGTDTPYPQPKVSLGSFLWVKMVLHEFPNCFFFFFLFAPLFSWIYAVLSRNFNISTRINQKFSQKLRLI